jgi:hypothetical protein
MKDGSDVVPYRKGPVIDSEKPLGSEKAKLDCLLVDPTGTVIFATVTVKGP